MRCWVAWVCRGSWSPHAQGQGPVVGGSGERDVAGGLPRQGELSFLSLQREEGRGEENEVRERRRKGKEGERWKAQHYFFIPPSDVHSLTKLFEGVLRSLDDHLRVVRRPHRISSELQLAPLLQDLYRKLSITPLCDPMSVCVCVCE